MRRRRPGWIGWLLAIVLAASAVAPASAQLPSSGAASGSAGGDLGGTYPDPTVTGVAGSPFGSGVATALHATAGATGSFALQSALASYCLITGCTYTGTVGVVNLNATGIINPAAAFTPTAGSGAASVSGNDQRFVVTTGTAQTSITANFGHTWTAAPVCTASSNSLAAIVDIASTSTTAISFGASVALSGATINVLCFGS